MSFEHDDRLMETIVADALEGDVLTEAEALEAVRDLFPEATERDLDRVAESAITFRKHGRFFM